MTTTTTTEEIKSITEALQKIHVRPFGCESSDPKYNAQRNLRGKTHYVDDDTLRFHKSRVLSAQAIHGGLLFRIVCSDSLDMHNTKRGFRAVVFDVFGTTIDRPKLEDATATRQAAINASDKQSIDLVAHYQAAIQSELRRRESDAKELREALEMISCQTLSEAQAA